MTVDPLSEMPIEQRARLLFLALQGLAAHCGHSQADDREFEPILCLAQSVEFGVDDLVEERERPVTSEPDGAPSDVQTSEKVRPLRPAG
jgi:hypothetical protein